MSALASALIHLYPRKWQRRYAAEMRELLEARKPSLRTIADLLAGAIDARLNPQLMPAANTGAHTEVESTVRRTICNPAGVSAADRWRGAAWLVGGSIALSAAGILLKLQIGPNALSDGLVYAAFPAALMLSTECTYLKRYSAPARTTISIGGAVFVVVVIWAAAAIANLI